MRCKVRRMMLEVRSPRFRVSLALAYYAEAGELSPTSE